MSVHDTHEKPNTEGYINGIIAVYFKKEDIPLAEAETLVRDLGCGVVVAIASVFAKNGIIFVGVPFGEEREWVSRFANQEVVKGANVIPRATLH